MVRRSLAGVDIPVFDFTFSEQARGLIANLKWLWFQYRASWLEVMGIYARTGRDIWRPPLF
jgi:hypothetical protein